MLLFVFVSLLVVEAYANAQFTPDAVHETGDQAAVPKAVLTGGPIINTVGEKPRLHLLPPKTLALTFDDGPMVDAPRCWRCCGSTTSRRRSS